MRLILILLSPPLDICKQFVAQPRVADRTQPLRDHVTSRKRMARAHSDYGVNPRHKRAAALPDVNTTSTLVEECFP